MKDYKIGVTMSGGSTKGAYQAGCLMALEDLGILNSVKYFSGTSVGAVNAAAMTSMNSHKLVNIYSKLSKRSEIFKATWYKFWNWKGLYSLEPLEDLLLQYLGGIKTEIEAVACVVSIANSKFEKFYASNKDMTDEKWFKYVMSSATVSGMMEPRDEKFLWFDGGFREYIPIKESLRRCEKVISIATTAREEHEILSHRFPWPFKGFLYLYHSVDGAMVKEIKIGDYLQHCKNNRVFVIEPETRIDIGMFEVSNEKMNKMIDQGYQQVMQRKDQLFEFILREI